MRVVLKHTAGLNLPAAPGTPLGMMLQPGANEVPDDYFESVVVGNPTVAAWREAGLLEFAAPSPPADPEPAPSTERKRRGG